jgi:nicotinate-nucleotide adenylyltransferase
MKKLGVLGGTFDPIHSGHLAIAEEAKRQIKLDSVVFMPAGHPYFKEARNITAAELRIDMLKQALADKPYFGISLIEVERPGPSYAVDSLTQMKSRLASEDELFFILGWDSLMNLYSWHAADRLIKLCRIAAAPRPGYCRPDLDLLEKQLPGISQRVEILEAPMMDISSTTIRERVSQGLPIDKMVPPAVERYIREKKLYL